MTLVVVMRESTGTGENENYKELASVAVEGK